MITLQNITAAAAAAARSEEREGQGLQEHTCNTQSDSRLKFDDDESDSRLRQDAERLVVRLADDHPARRNSSSTLKKMTY
jgi:hypothetical protein